jgi:hypothetical protein
MAPDYLPRRQGRRILGTAIPGVSWRHNSDGDMPMSDATPAFDFSQFVPGFDFLKNLAAGAAAPGQGAGSVSGLPSLSNWVAPTLSVEEVDKRIQELKTVQYWLEQNGHALKATIQALEVQKMTLSTLRGMNVRMEDLANAFTRNANAATAAVMPSAPTPPVAPPPEAPSPAPATPMTSFFNRMAEAMQPPAAEAEEEAPEPEPAEPVVDARAVPAGDRADGAPSEESRGAQDAAAGAMAGVIDPLQWWGSLTQQFQQIAESAMRDAAQIQMPAMPQMPSAPGPAKTSRAAKSGGSTGTAKTAKAAASASPSPAAKKTASASGAGTSRAKAAPASASARSASPAAKTAPRKSAAAPASGRRSRG